MNFYPRHIGDFISDTVGLSMIEDGAYNRLIDHCYQSEAPLPLDPEEIYRIARVRRAADRHATDYVLNKFFKKTQTGYVQKRVEAEIAHYKEKQAKARGSAKVRWSKENANALRTHCDGNANQEPITNNQEPKKDKRLSPSASLQAHPIANANGPVDNSEMVLTAEEIPKTNGKAPDCPYAVIAEAYHEELPELPSIVVLSPNRKRALQARWREVCTAEHLNAEQGIRFFRDFFKRIKQSEFLIGKAPPKQQGGRSFRADFDWIINPQNFIKIVEGRYHGRRN